MRIPVITSALYLAVLIIYAPDTSATSCENLTSPLIVDACGDGIVRVAGNTLIVQGRLSGKIYALLARLLNENAETVNRLVLNSTGGNIDGGNLDEGTIYQVAELIRRHELTTVLPEGSICASACTLLFQAGRERLMSPSSRLVYHGVRILNSYYVFHYLYNCRKDPQSRNCLEFNDKWYRDCETATRSFFDTLEVYGGSPSLYKALSVMPEEDEYLKKYNCFRRVDLSVDSFNALTLNVITSILPKESLPVKTEILPKE